MVTNMWEYSEMPRKSVHEICVSGFEKGIWNPVRDASHGRGKYGGDNNPRD